MAAEPQPPALSDSGTESAIRRLLNRQAQLTDQQAQVQAELATLLPSQYGSNIKLELHMLRHKLHALRAYAALHGTTPSGAVFCVYSRQLTLFPSLGTRLGPSPPHPFSDRYLRFETKIIRPCWLTLDAASRRSDQPSTDIRSRRGPVYAVPM